MRTDLAVSPKGQTNRYQFSYYKFSLNLIMINFCYFIIFLIYETCQLHGEYVIMLFLAHPLLIGY